MRTQEIHTMDDGVEAEEVALLDGANALSAVDRAAIDVQIQTAKAHPRSVTRAIREAETLATLDEETAASCFYGLRRSGKLIEGPSTRLAEIMAYSWGNLRVDADIVAEDRTHITAMGTCFDLEKNVAIRVRVKRRITNKSGDRYNDDMIGVTGNAAMSIALRNAIFRVVPQALVRRVYQAAREASVGKAGTITQKRQALVEWFGKSGITEDQVIQIADVGGLDDIGVEEIITLRGIANSIKEGEIHVESLIRDLEGTTAGTADLNAALSDDPEPTPEESERRDQLKQQVEDAKAADGELPLDGDAA